MQKILEFLWKNRDVALATIGYEHEGNGGIEGREMFKYSGKEHLMEHHLYVCPEDSRELKRHVLFRDYLRSHPDAVQSYSQIKKGSVRKYCCFLI